MVHKSRRAGSAGVSAMEAGRMGSRWTLLYRLRRGEDANLEWKRWWEGDANEGVDGLESACA